jgi:hypothetical protein
MPKDEIKLKADSAPWICPKCDRVWGPSVTNCAPCNERGPFGSKRSSGTVRDGFGSRKSATPRYPGYPR